MNARLLAIATMLLLVISGCGQSYNPELDKGCEGCDLSGADLMGANLLYANLSRADLTDADLTDANLDRVIGADFTGALDVATKYR